MKTSECIGELKRLLPGVSCLVIDNILHVVIGSHKNCNLLAVVDNRRRYSFHIHSSDMSDEITGNLFETLVEYARTPIKERD